MIFAAGFSTSDIDPTTGVEVQLADGASEFYGTIDELVSASNTASSNATALSTAAGAADAISFDHKFAGEDIPTDFVSYADLVQARNTANAEKAEFFAVDRSGRKFASSTDIDDEITRLTQISNEGKRLEEAIEDAQQNLETAQENQFLAAQNATTIDFGNITDDINVTFSVSDTTYNGTLTPSNSFTLNSV